MFLYSAKAIIFVPEDKKRVGPSKAASFFFPFHLISCFTFPPCSCLRLSSRECEPYCKVEGITSIFFRFHVKMPLRILQSWGSVTQIKTVCRASQ